jgi:RNA polymerase sigma factor (sigma-70 family)
MSDVHRTIEAVWKVEATRLIAAISRDTHDIGVAEELAHDALIAALERWPEEGTPDNPASWLMTAAKRRAIDSLRRGRMLVQKHEEITQDLHDQQQRFGDAMEQALDQVIDDDVLRLVFTACHPVLTIDARVALTLRLIGGLSTAEIARAFLVPEKTMGQRIFRAKKTLSDAQLPFETPRGDDLQRRMKSVLSVVYLIFNEGYTATSGEEWMRAALCDEALRLGRMLAQLLPLESEVHALLALMELNAARTAARLEVRYFALQAAIASCHMRARAPEETDWDRIVSLYDVLMQTAASPVVALNRAVAVGMARGPAAGVDALDAIATPAGGPALTGYHLFHSVRGDLPMKMGRLPEAREEIRLAITMTQNRREHELLTGRLKQIEDAAAL